MAEIVDCGVERSAVPICTAAAPSVNAAAIPRPSASSSRRDHGNADGVDDLRQERKQAGLAPYVLGIKSQAHEGWKLVRERYDDAGFSGGSMERPALQKPLDDVRARKIDVIVVWAGYRHAFGDATGSNCPVMTRS